jgi:hypothetical protein
MANIFIVYSLHHYIYEAICRYVIAANTGNIIYNSSLAMIDSGQIR